MSGSRIPPNIIRSAVSQWEAGSGSQWVTISGTSMWPLLRSGDEVLVAYGNSELNTGQIAQFQLGNINVVHRITTIAGDSITLRGDNRFTDDPEVARQDVIGVVVQRRRFGRITILDQGAGLRLSQLSRFVGQSKCQSFALLRKLGVRRPSFMSK